MFFCLFIWFYICNLYILVIKILIIWADFYKLITTTIVCINCFVKFIQHSVFNSIFLLKLTLLLSFKTWLIKLFYILAINILSPILINLLNPDINYLFGILIDSHNSCIIKADDLYIITKMHTHPKLTAKIKKSKHIRLIIKFLLQIFIYCILLLLLQLQKLLFFYLCLLWLFIILLLKVLRFLSFVYFALFFGYAFILLLIKLS